VRAVSEVERSVGLLSTPTDLKDRSLLRSFGPRSGTVPRSALFRLGKLCLE